MVDLKTKYLGLELKNPIIVGSSGLTGNFESIERLAANGAAAVVIKSLFEEEIRMEYRHTVSKGLADQDSNLDFLDYFDYELKHDMLTKCATLIRDVKSRLGIKVIASINCSSAGEWFSYAAKLEEAGADAIELNIYRLETDVNMSAAAISERYLNIVKKVLDHVSIPVAVKLPPYMTDTAYMAGQLAALGVKGLVLFNRFYNPDFDLESNRIVSGQVYSNPSDYAWPLRWISVLSGKVDIDLAASNGIHNAETAIKMLLAGADAVQLVSAIYKNGAGYLMDILTGIEKWMKARDFKDLEAVRAYGRSLMPADPGQFERVQFMKYFGDYSS